MSASGDIISYFAAGNEVLFSGKDAKDTESYYAALTANQPYEVRYTGPQRGKSLFALKDFEVGETVLVEHGWVSMQAETNKSVARVCATCYRYVGSVVSQLEHLLGREMSDVERATVEEAAELAGVEAGGRLRPEVPCVAGCKEIYCSEACGAKAWKEYHSMLCPNARPDAKEAIEAFNQHANDTNEIFVLAAKVFGRVALDVREHDMTIEESLAPLRMFVKDYWWKVMEPGEDDTDEFESAIKAVLADSLGLLREVLPFSEIEPLFTVDFYALLIGLFERNNLSIEVPHPVVGCFDHLPPWTQSHVVDAVKKALEAVEPNCACGGDHGKRAHTHDSSPHIHSEACSHPELDQEDPIPPPPNSTPSFKLTSADSDVDSDVHSLLSTTHTFRSTMSALTGATNGDDPLAILDALLCEGTGLHPLQATINHDCDPNCRVVAKDIPEPKLVPSVDGASSVTDGRKGKTKSVGRVVLPDEAVGGADGRTVIKAVRKIKAGEEIVISYVDEDEDEGGVERAEGDSEEAREEDEEERKAKKEERRRALREYGIGECHCRKCSEGK
ncbi:hypothetical protein HK104_003396 [Borealophlyctis nickersoniae]|nr:hypothetical protein HK104_003396 [Borealophlyctis nickersoniae]